MPTIHADVHNPIHKASQTIHTTANRESKPSHQSFTEVKGVNRQVQNDHSQAIHTASQHIHGPLARVKNSSPEGGFFTAGLRRRGGVTVARAGQILAMLHRVEGRGIEVSEAERKLRQAMEGDHDPAEVLAELLTVANSCRGEKTYQGTELDSLARRVLVTTPNTSGGEE